LKDTSQGAARDDWIIAETQDFVKVGLRADVFYSINDAFQMIVTVGKEGVQELIMETAIGTLTSIIRSTKLHEIAQQESPGATSQDEEAVKAAQALGKPSAPMFFDRAHDEFLHRLHDDFKNRYGIDISNIRIESFKIMNEELAQ